MLAVEWSPDGIRVNCIAPGRFPHEDLPGHMTRHREGERGDNTIPGMRVGEVRELGWAATFLCSPYASYISGHTLVVDAANRLRRSLVMARSEEHTSELQSLMRLSYAVFCLKKKEKNSI